MVRTITVSKMGSAGKTVEIRGNPTFRKIVEAAGFTSFKAIMSDALGYVDANATVDEATTMLILSAPKFDAGFGALPSYTVEDSQGNEFVLTPVEPTAVVVEDEPTRTITVSKMGSAGVTVSITSRTTYGQAVTEAGFTTFKAIMADSEGYVEPDAVIAPSVNMLILSAPKFDAGFGALPSYTVEDSQGNEFVLTPVEPTAVVVEDVPTRTITVSKMGSAGVTISITASTTYRQAVTEAGYTTFKAIMADSEGYVEPDAVIAPSVNMLILSAPKFDAGN